jgi:putative ABC transport system permease protein
MTQYSVDEDFNLLYNIQLVSGRNFSPQFQTDSSACILNEKAVGALGLSAGDAIGKTLFIGRSKCTIVGVVKDFYYSSHRRPIRPLVMRMVAHRFNFVSIKFNGGDLKNNLEKVESVYRSFLPDQPVNFRFVDDEVQNRFREENRLEKIFSYFSTIAIVVASFGLFGLAAYSTSQRSREVAIRKILGASPSGIAFKLVFEFVVLVLLAGAIGIPMAYTFIQEWLTQFPDTIYIGWGLFAQSMLICIFVAILSVSYKSILIALSNPAKVLRSE